MKIEKTLLFMLFAIVGATISAKDFATVRIKYLDGKSGERRVEMIEVSEGVKRVRLPAGEIPRSVKWIDVIADVSTAKKGDDGFYVLPNGAYLKFDKDKGKLFSKPVMPLMGFKTPKGAAAVIVKGLSLEFKPAVEVENGAYKIFPRFDIEGIEFDLYEDIIVDYHMLSSGDATYAGVARAYRKHQLAGGAVKPLRERVKNNGTLKFSADSIYVRVKMATRVRRGVPRDKWADAPMVVNHTFADVKDILQRIKNEGMDNVEFCFVGWQKGGHDGPFPDLFPVPSELGGESSMIETVKFGRNLGFQMTTHVNHHDAVKKASRYSTEDIAWDLKGDERKYTLLPGGQVYHNCYQVVYNKYLDADLSKLKSMGLNGIQHVDVTTARLPTQCHNPRHPLNRKGEAEYARKISQKCKDVMGGYSSEAGYDFIADVTDYVLYVVWTGAEDELVSKNVPLWQIVYNGIIMSGAPYYSTIDASYSHDAENFSDSSKSFRYLDYTWKRRMKLIEFCGRPSFYYIDYSDLKPMKSLYDEYMKLKHLQYEFLEDHAEIFGEVFMSRYSDGTRIVYNYRDKEISYEGRTVPAQSYIVIK